MALSRVKTWNAAETLTASDLNAEFNNVCNHFGSLNNDDINSTATYTMGELIVGSGIASADGGQLHVHTATAGTIQASADADEAVFENSGASGVTILSGATSTGNIAFGDSGDADNGLLKYTHGATPTLGITVNATAVQSIAAAATTLAHDLAVYQDANNADSQIALGTSATEALFVEALNGGSNKTLEELRFTTKTASGTANHGKMSFYVDEVNIGNVNDDGITLESGKIFTGNITGNVTGNTSGTAATVTSGTQAAITAAANLVTVGTIGTGVWQGTAVASAYLDADTAHLSTTQTFTGDKTFTGTVTVGVDDTGKDVKFFGASAGAYMEWDESADQLRLMGASADATTSTGKLLLATSLADINANDVLGKIDFQAPHEAGGTDATTIAASIQAIAQGTFSASVNATDLIFYTGHSEAATEKFRFTSQGELGVGGANYGTDGQVLTSGGAGAAAAWENAASSGISWDGSTANGVATFKDSDEATVEANLTFDGSTLSVTGAALVNSGATKVISEFTSSNTNRMIVVSADSETLNDTVGIAFNATASSAIGSTHSIAAIEGKVTQAGTLKGDLIFHVNAGDSYTERMRITSAGNVAIGNPGSDFPLLVNADKSGEFVTRIENGHASNPWGVQLYFSGADPDDNTSQFLHCRGNGAAARTIIYGDGDVWTSDQGTLSSDNRLKTNIVDASDKLADVLRLQVRNFEWTPEYHPNKVGEKKIGFIAQELETVFPSLVFDHDIASDNSIKEELYGAEDDTQYYVDGDETPDGKEVGDVKTESQIPEGKAIGDVKVAAKDHEPLIRKSYKNAFVPILVKALQEVTVRLEAAEAKITALESA